MGYKCDTCGEKEFFIKVKEIAKWEHTLNLWVYNNEKIQIECDNCGSVRVIETKEEL